MKASPRAVFVPDAIVAGRLASAPSAPGVYWMEGRTGRVLYVGKSRNLRDRLRSHFHHTRGPRQKVQKNLHRVREIHWMTTTSETEALVLEESLIREHKPSLNVMLPHYRFLGITADEPFPRLGIKDEMKPDDGSLYFGPYPDRAALDRLYNLLMPLFRIRGDADRCDWDGATPRKPCHCFEFGWCSAPCSAAITPEAYREDAAALASFLKGSLDNSFAGLVAVTAEKIAATVEECQRLKDDIAQLGVGMKKAARALQFETAAGLRDRQAIVERHRLGAEGRLRRLQKQHAALNGMTEVKGVVQPHLPDVDAWGLVGDGETFALVVLPFRQGRLRKGLQETGSLEGLAATLRRHYKKKNALPPSILLVRLQEEDGPVMALWQSVIARLDPERLPRLCRAEEDEAWSAAAELVRLNVPAVHSPGGAPGVETPESTVIHVRA